MKGDKQDHVSSEVVVECPADGTDATMKVTTQNPWDPTIGPHVIRCSHLHEGETCGEACMQTPEGIRCIKMVATADLAEHKQDLGTVGPNVIG